MRFQLFLKEERSLIPVEKKNSICSCIEKYKTLVKEKNEVFIEFSTLEEFVAIMEKIGATFYLKKDRIVII